MIDTVEMARGMQAKSGPVYAIAVRTFPSPSGNQMAMVTSCPVAEHLGQRWCLNNPEDIHGDAFLVRFEPADQYCTVVDLAKMRKPDNYYADEAKENLLRAVRHHRAHCDGPACNIQLFLLRKLGDMAGLTFTDEESKLFL